jgi:hypothetical protein
VAEHDGNIYCCKAEALEPGVALPAKGNPLLLPQNNKIIASQKSADLRHKTGDDCGNTEVRAFHAANTPKTTPIMIERICPAPINSTVFQTLLEYLDKVL